jgi:hypothetical protein
MDGCVALGGAPKGDTAGMAGTDVERLANGSAGTAPGPTAGMEGNVERPCAAAGGRVPASGGIMALFTANVCWHTVHRMVMVGAPGSGSMMRIRDWQFSHVTIMRVPPGMAGTRGDGRVEQDL